VAGTYRPGFPVTRVASFARVLDVIVSKQRPRKLSLHGDDGVTHNFLLKGHEDLRQDERVMQVPLRPHPHTPWHPTPPHERVMQVHVARTHAVPSCPRTPPWDPPSCPRTLASSPPMVPYPALTPPWDPPYLSTALWAGQHAALHRRRDVPEGPRHPALLRHPALAQFGAHLVGGTGDAATHHCSEDMTALPSSRDPTT
jgi:hypothetical protein